MNLTELGKEIGEEAAIRVAVEQLGMTEDYARFVMAMERGEVDGDAVEVDENGEPIRKEQD